ncbi:MAG: thioredoxin family protein [Burkholderiales bacterium]
MIKNFAKIFTLAFLAFAPLAAKAEATIGQPAPELSLPAHDGSTQSLSAFKGKIVVLEWLNKDCPFVHKHYDTQNMQNLQKEMTAKDVVWLTISSSAEGKQGYMTADVAKATVAEKGAAPSFVLLDHSGAVGKSYGAKTTPHMFVVDANGVLAYAGAIDDKPSADKADVTTAKNFVRQAVEQLQAGQAVTETSTKAYGCSVKYAD